MNSFSQRPATPSKTSSKTNTTQNSSKSSNNKWFYSTISTTKTCIQTFKTIYQSGWTFLIELWSFLIPINIYSNARGLLYNLFYSTPASIRKMLKSRLKDFRNRFGNCAQMLYQTNNTMILFLMLWSILGAWSCGKTCVSSLAVTSTIWSVIWSYLIWPSHNPTNSSSMKKFKHLSVITSGTQSLAQGDRLR